VRPDVPQYLRTTGIVVNLSTHASIVYKKVKPMTLMIYWWFSNIPNVRVDF